jgi:hypothetical protein
MTRIAIQEKLDDKVANGWNKSPPNNIAPANQGILEWAKPRRGEAKSLFVNILHANLAESISCARFWR